jgi:outer membrane usher protein
VVIHNRAWFAGSMAMLGLAGAALAQAPALGGNDAVKLKLDYVCVRCAQVADRPEAARPSERLLPVEVMVNKASVGQWTLLEREGTLYAPSEAFSEWRVQRPQDVPPVTYRGQPWYALSRVPGFQSRFDYANQALELAFSPTAFVATRLATGTAERAPLSRKLDSVFLNYDVSYTTASQRFFGRVDDLGVLGEAGVSYGPGVLVSSFLGQNLAGDDVLARPRKWTRLETTYTRDFPDSDNTLRLGDSSTRTGMWGRSVYFGGFQAGRNYGLHPGYITQPIPVITGSSAAPSTVELYINDALRQTSSVPTGPFAIDNFPLLTGAGEARVVVRDLLGRETVLVQPFFTHSELLDAGLTDWSVEAGAVRRELGFESSRYGDAFASGFARHGVSKLLTVEGRFEASRALRGGGAGVSYALPFQALGQAAIAVSDEDERGRGTKALLGVEHLRLRHGLTARIERASRDYRQVGMDARELAFKTQASASYRYTSETFGALGLGMARIETFQPTSVTTYSANYAIRVGEQGTLSFAATRVKGLADADSIGVTLILPLEGRLIGTANVTHKGGQTDSYAGLAKTLGAESGFGWRGLAGRRAAREFVEGGLYYQGGKGLLSADMNASSEDQTLRLGAQGAVVAADGRFFATRRIHESFALVEVPGYADIGVGFHSSMIARTDAEGVVLLTGLMPYQRNSIRLDPSELPINAELDSIEEIAVPESRSGVKVSFPVRSGRGALIRIVLEDGEPAPAGAEIELVGDKKEFFVARRGEAFVTGLADRNTLRLKWKNASCALDIALPPGALDELARIGPVLCKGVRR